MIIKVGDKVKLINKKDKGFGWNPGLKIGNIYKVTEVVDPDYLGTPFIRIYVSKNYPSWALPESSFRKIVGEQMLFQFMYD